MKRPYITLKFAQTLDGRIAARDGSSRWISGRKARRFAHTLRAAHDAVLVGANTVLRDNPSLTTRLVKGKNPVRIIIDGRLRIRLDSSVVKNTKKARTIVVTTLKAPKGKLEKLRKKGVECVLQPASRSGNIDLRRIIRILYGKGIKSILVEGGSNVITSFLRAGLADKITVIISPAILGRGLAAVGDLGIANIKGVLKLRRKNIKRLGRDIIYTAFLH